MNKTIRLIWQLYPTYLVITLIALGAASWYSTKFLSDHFIQSTLSGLTTQGRIAEVIVRKHLSPDNASEIDRICKQIGKSTLTRITVILLDGKVIGDSEEDPSKMDNHINRPEVRSALTGDIGSSQRYSRTLQKRMMYMAFPLKRGNKMLAILRMSIPLTEVDAELARIQSSIALGGFLIAVLAAVICFFVSHRISKPIEELKKGAEYFAAGNLNHRLPLPSTQETAGLAEAMNIMGARLKERIASEINQRNEISAILSSMTEGVIAIDTRANIISFNQAAGKIIEGLKESAKGQGLQAVIRNLQLNQFVDRAIKKTESISEDILLHQLPQRIVNVHATPLKNAKQDRIGTLLVLNDVTQLRHLEKMRQDFVANVSHEIKTPLTAIKGFVETLQSGAKDNPEEAKRFIAIIEKHANRLEAIVEDLLLLSRIEMENEAKEIQFEQCPLKNILRSAIQICTPKARAKNIDVILGGDDTLTANINPAMLEQALINLIDNAVKYSGEKSNVKVETGKTETELFIHITDNGIGISKKHIPRLFERFYRVDKARSRDQGGTGLGLAIVKHIVNAHGGHVTVESERGKGSQFTIHLPY